MNRKEVIIVGVVLLVSFISGGYAAPSIQQVFVTNFPSNQHVTVTNPDLNVTVTNPTTSQNTASQKLVEVIDGMNITLPSCSTCAPDHDGTLVAISPVNSSLGFRQATIYVHWVSISPGLANAGLWLYVTQKPSAQFPGYACALQSGANCLQAIPNIQTQGGQGSFSMIVNVTGEQFAFYMTAGSTTGQQITELSISIFLSN